MRQKVVGIYKPDNALQIVYCPHSKEHSWTIAGAFSILVSTIPQPAIKHHLHANKPFGRFARVKTFCSCQLVSAQGFLLFKKGNRLVR